MGFQGSQHLVGLKIQNSLSVLPLSLAASFGSFSKHLKCYHFCVENEGILFRNSFASCFVNFWVIIKDFQNLLLGWVAKRLMSSYKHCKVMSFQSLAKYVLFEISDSKSLGSLVLSYSYNIQNILSCWVSGSQFIVECKQMTSQKIRL